ncbi:GHKL domain-containing protein [Enterococcus faecalis]
MINNWKLFIVVAIQTITIFAGNIYLNPYLRLKKYFAILICLIPVILYLYLTINIFTTVLIWCVLCLLSAVSSKKIIESLYLTSISLILYILSDYFFVFIFGEVALNVILRSVVSSVTFMVLLIVLKKCDRYFFTEKYRWIFCVTSVVTLFVYFITISVERFSVENIMMERTNLFFLVFYALVSIMVTICTIHFFRIYFNAKDTKSELERLRDINRIIEESNSEVRKFMHDFNSVILSIEDYIENQDWDSLTEYYYKELRNIPHSLNNRVVDTTQTNNLMIPELRGLLLNKLLTAFSLTKRVTVEIPEPIDFLPINKLDAVRILGILLDNAIEEICEQDQGRLSLFLFKMNNYTYVVVTNSIVTKNHSIAQLQKKGFSTKGNNRGLGLSNLDEIVSKYQYALMETKIENNEFIQVLSFFDKGE